MGGIFLKEIGCVKRFVCIRVVALFPDSNYRAILRGSGSCKKYFSSYDHHSILPYNGHHIFLMFQSG